jgi:hypothetical protein
MPETPEQQKARQDKYWTDRNLTPPGAGGKAPPLFEANRERGDDLKRHPSAMSGNAPPKGPKAREKSSSVTPEMEALVPEPCAVRVVPTTPWGLYTHFRKAVRSRWPGAILAAHDKPTLKFCSDMLKKFPPEIIYEMIQVLVMDYEHVEHARVFFKFKGGATPIFKQLFANADLIGTWVGKGIASPGKTSLYLEDYNRRHGKTETNREKTDEERLAERLAAPDNDPRKSAQ